jgi:F-type H+-transporting ATPase subunit delta
MARAQSMMSYVKVLSELCESDDKFLSVVEEAEQIIDCLWNDSLLRDFLCNPAIKKDVREKTMKTVFESAGVSTEWKNLFVLMVRKERMSLLQVFKNELRLYADKRCGIIRGVAHSAVELNEETQGKIQSFLKEQLKSEIALSYHTDPQILGGLKVSMGEIILDASLEWKLKEAKSKLIKTRA